VDKLIELLRENQAPNGAFPSFVLIREQRIEDCNGFVTAQMLRALHDLPDERVAEIRTRALDFITSCQSRQRPGAFGFYPEGEQPAWMLPLPQDTDDTAIIVLELFQHGRLDRQTVLSIACKVLIPHRLHWIEPPAPPWLRPGAFVTWLRGDTKTNIVDCCANANIVALFAAAGIRHLPGYSEACAMIEDGVQWAATQETSSVKAESRMTVRERLGVITPFYPHPLELLYALENAVMYGAEQLRPCLEQLRGMKWEEEEADERPICGNAYGKVQWISPILQKVRQWRIDQLPLQTQG